MGYIGKIPTPVALTASDITDGIISSAKIADGTIATADIADSAVTKAKTTGVVSDPFRNIIINGDMSIAQRSTSTTSITGAGYHTVDRYQIYLASLGTWTMSQSTDVPSGQGFAKSCKFDCTTADSSPAASDEFYFRQRFEGQFLQYLKYGTSSAQSLTLSFWVKCNKTTTATVALQDHDNTKMQVKSYTISSANTWEKKTITFSGNTSDSFANDNNLSLDVRWWLDSGSNFTSGTPSGSWEANDNTKKNPNNLALASSTSNEWYITGIQLEAGTSASDFEFLPHDVTLRRCQRYYQFEDGTVGNGGTSHAEPSLDFPIAVNVRLAPEMRAAPTATISGTNALYDSSNSSVSANVNTVSKTMWHYGRKQTGSGSSDYGIQFSDIKYDAEL